MIEYVIRRFEGVDDFNEPCMFAEVQFDKNVLCNGGKHCKHFFVQYNTEEELEEIMSHFEFEEEEQ